MRAAANLAEEKTDFLPRKFDPAELRRDVSLYDQLIDIHAKVVSLAELMDDTTMLAGSEAMAGALVVYNSAQRHGAGEALDGALDDLAARFRRRNGSVDEPVAGAVPTPAA